MPQLAYLSLGSNVGDRVAHLRDAIARLESIGRVVSVSSFYETEPVEVTDQPWFLNCAVGLETALTAEQLMARLLQLEQEMGRRRIQKKGPRTIDIDILLFDDLILDSPDVTIPHPAMQKRRFVLEPLAEIAAEARHPGIRKQSGSYWRSCRRGKVLEERNLSHGFSRIFTDTKTGGATSLLTDDGFTAGQFCCPLPAVRVQRILSRETGRREIL